MPAAKPAYPELQRGKPLADAVGLWPCHEGSGATLNDLSPNNNAGSFGAAAAWSAGQSGPCLSFAGGTSGVSIPGGALDLTGSFTLACWFTVGSVVASDFLCGKPKTTSPFGGYYLRTNNNHVQVLAGIGGAFKNVIGTIGFAANAWTHAAATYDGATLRLYTNAAADTTLSVSGAVTVSGLPFRVGGNGAGNESALTGLVDAVAVYARALSQPEIAALAADSWSMLRRRSWRLAAAAGATFSPGWVKATHGVLGAGTY